jgi:UDP-4-amino-4,6-dideoxy-N-acetyl-beta-L-altrosamine transaminase
VDDKGRIAWLDQRQQTKNWQDMTTPIPYGRQEVTQADIDAVVEVLKSDFLTQGPTVSRFESAVADYAQASHAVAVNSATSALHIACLALGLGKGDWLWTTPVTFVASSNCGLYCGANIDFVDIDPETTNISVRALETKLEAASENGRLPKIIVAVHLSGTPCPMKDIYRLSQQYGVRVIEDASHAIGGRYLGQPIGNCAYSDITVFSFHPVKIITSAEGGMALTNDASLAKSMMLFRSHGISRDPDDMTHVPDGPWYYQQLMLGYNYRLTDVQAALGLSQLERVDQYVAARHRIAADYDQLLADLPLVLPAPNPDGYSGLHLYVVRLDPARTNCSRLDVFNALREEGIGVNLHYVPVHLQPYYRAMGFERGDFPNAENYYDQAITIPLYPGLTKENIHYVVASLRQALCL